MTNLQLRQLKATDVFAIMNLIGKLDLIDPLKDLFNGSQKDELIQAVSQEGTKDEQATQLGLAMFAEVAQIIVNNIPKCEQDIYTLLADVYQTDVQTIKDLSLNDFIGLIVVFLKHPDFSELFKSIKALTNLD